MEWFTYLVYCVVFAVVFLDGGVCWEEQGRGMLSKIG